MTANTQADLRVIKTKRAIKAAFYTLICQKPVNKITVAALAKTALINKGTFYLHYQDIFALYDELVEAVATANAREFQDYDLLVENPREFVQRFLFDVPEAPSPAVLALLKPENLKFATTYPNNFIDAIRTEIYATGQLTANRENDLRLEFMITGMISILIRPGLINQQDPHDQECVVDLLTPAVEQLTKPTQS